MKDEGLYTTDYKKCRENAETAVLIRVLSNMNWESFSHDELVKINEVVTDIIISKEVN